MCERWVGDWTDCNILKPSSSDYSSTFFLILLGCSTGSSEGPNPQLGAGSHCLELQLELQLTDSNWLELSVAPGYIIVWHPSASCGRRICTEFNPSTCQGDIFERMHLFLDWRLGRRSICYSLCVSCGPASEPTFKKALCRTCIITVTFGLIALKTVWTLLYPHSPMG